MEPEALYRLITDVWMLPFPKAIISINGEFPKCDPAWNQVKNEVFFFTTGSSPSRYKLFNSTTIAIMNIDSVRDKELLTDLSNSV